MIYYAAETHHKALPEVRSEIGGKSKTVMVGAASEDGATGSTVTAAASFRTPVQRCVFGDKGKLQGESRPRWTKLRRLLNSRALRTLLSVSLIL